MKKRYFDWETSIFTLAVLVCLAAAGGYLANIVKLAHMTFDQFTPLLVLRAIGIVTPPLGAVLGFL